MRANKVAVLLTHPIQYFSPFFRQAAACKDIDLTVYYCSREGHEVFRDKEFGREVKWDLPLLEGYKSVFLTNLNPLGGINRGFWGLVNGGLPAELIKERYDLVLVHGWGYFTAWLAFMAAILSGTPFAVRGESPLNQEVLKSKLNFWLKKVLLGAVFRRMRAAMAIGTQNAAFYRYYGVPDHKIKVMPYSVDNAFFMATATSLRASKTELRRKHGLPEHKVIVNFTGKLSSKKRPLDLLQAYEGVRSTDKALLFVGDGPLLEELKAYVEKENVKDVYFAGFKNQSEISELYAVSDIFVLPSGPGETWGLVVNEAMCFSLPVIVSSTVGCAVDLVKNGENGFVFQQGDTLKLSEHLKELIDSQHLRSKMGENSFRVVSGWGFPQDISAIRDLLVASDRDLAPFENCFPTKGTVR